MRTSSLLRAATLLGIFAAIATLARPQISSALITQPDVSVTECPGASFAIPSLGRLGWAYMDPNQDVLDIDKTAHRGLDIFPFNDAIDTDREVRAAHGGTIAHLSGSSLRIINDTGAVDTYYSHMAPLADTAANTLADGDRVVKGQLIGRIFKGSHLHFVIIKKDDPLFNTEYYFENSFDPSPFLNANLNYFDNGNYPAIYPNGKRIYPYPKTVSDFCNSAAVGGVSGIVRLPNGQEVSDARVAIESLGQTRKTNFWLGPGDQFPDQKWDKQTRGSYTFTNIPPGEYLIKVTKDGLSSTTYKVTPEQAAQNYIGYARVVVSANSPAQVADIVLQPDTTPAISGYIRDSSGSGVGGVTVTLRGSADIPTTTTDSTGLYLFSSVPTGQYKIFAHSDSAGEGATDIEVPQYRSVQAGDIKLIPFCKDVAQTTTGAQIFCIGNGVVGTGRDFALIIDTSGSMAWNDSSRLRAEAAKLFAATIDPQDRLAVIGFSSSGYNVWELQSVDGQQARFNTLIDQYIGIGGGTNISDGLSKAYAQLDDGADRHKIAILLTDGQQDPPASYNPYWQAAFAQKGWPVYTFGLSSAADTARLQGIATATGGTYTALTDATLIAQFYNNLRVQITGSRRLADIAMILNQDQTYSTLVTVPPFTQLVRFVTAWPGSQVDTALRAPDGTIIHPDSADPFVSHEKQRTFEIYRLRYPMAGRWTIIAYGAQLAAAGERVTIQADASISFQQTFLPQISNGVAQPIPAAPAPAEPPSAATAPTIVTPAGTIGFSDAAPIAADTQRTLQIQLTAGEATAWSGGGFSSNCSIGGLPGAFSTAGQPNHTISSQITIPASAAGQICTISGIVTTAGTAYSAGSLPLALTFSVGEMTAAPPTVTPGPTVAAPRLALTLIDAASVVAGTERTIVLSLTADEPTTWSAPTFTSDCPIGGLPGAFSAGPTASHTISATISLPADTGRRTCTIQGTVSAHSAQYPATSLPASLALDIYAQERVTVPDPLWSNASSVDLVGGCVTATGYINGANQDLAICDSSAAIESGWNDQIKELSAVCGPSSPPITIRLWKHFDYQGDSWPYTFCKPPSAAGSVQYLELAITADNMDAYEDGVFRLSGDGLYDNWVGSSQDVMTGWVFAGASIPKGATILNAQVRSHGFGTNGESTASIHGFAQDSAPPFAADGSDMPSRRPLTGAVIPWTRNWPYQWVWFNTPDLAPIVQEVINRSGWASGNAIGLRISNLAGVGTNWCTADFAQGPYVPYSNGPGHYTHLFIAYTAP